MELVSSMSTAAEGGAPRTAGAALTFDAVYSAHFDFAWRSLRRLGVPDASIDDAAQEVFLVVHRRLSEFEGRSSVKTWIFGIAMRVARDARRTLKRKGGHAELRDSVPDLIADSPADHAQRTQAVKTLHELLAELDEDKRAVFILAELEQMTAPEIAESLGANVNTIYARLRAARREFELALERKRSSMHDDGRTR